MRVLELMLWVCAGVNVGLLLAGGARQTWRDVAITAGAAVVCAIVAQAMPTA